MGASSSSGTSGISKISVLRTLFTFVSPMTITASMVNLPLMKVMKMPPTLRLTYRASFLGAAIVFAPGQLCMADDPSGLVITHNNYGRAVSGSDHEVGFTLSNFDPQDVHFTLGATGNTTNPTPFEHDGSPISAGLPVTQQPYFFTADTSGPAGTSISVGMTATEVEPGTRSASSSFDLQLLENRTISFSLAGPGGNSFTNEQGVLELGRFIGNYVVREYNSGTGSFSPISNYSFGRNLDLIMNGGPQGRELATDVGWNPALLSDPYGLSLKDTEGNFAGTYYSKNFPSTNSATANFNDSDVEHSVRLSLFQGAGAFSQTIDFASETNLAGAFSPESVSGVAISGAQVQFSGSEITIQGNNLSNRTIFATSDSGNGITTNGVNVRDYRDNSAKKGGLFDTNAEIEGIQSRVMVGSSGTILAGTDTWTLSSPGADANTARVNFTGSGLVNSGLLSVDTGSPESVTSFDGTQTRSVTASWGTITYGTDEGVGINTSTNKVFTSAANLTSNLSSGEVGGLISGQSLGNLSVGYSLEVVSDRSLYVNNISRKAFNGTEVGALTNTIYGNLGAYTNPTVTNQDGASSVITNTSSSFTDIIGANMGTTGGGSGTRSLTVTPEGLVGEREAYDIGYNWSLSRVNKAEMQTELTGALNNPPVFSNGNYSLFDHNFTRDENVQGDVSLGTFSLYQTNAGLGTADASIYASQNFFSRGFSYDVDTTNAGRSKIFDFSFDDTGLLDGSYFGSVWIRAEHADQSIIGASWNDLGVYEHLFEVVVTGRGENTGYKGFRITQFDSTSAQVSEGTTAMQILDIIEPGGERGVSMELLAENGQVLGPNGEVVAFTSGQVQGLDGVKFVLQSSYDEAELIANFSTESVATLLWRNASGEFVNAVLGNQGDAENGTLPEFSKVGQRFVGSYAAYLASLGEGAVPLLGDFGYDPVANTVWAVLDHNSTFGGAGAVALGVPEPSTAALLLVTGALLLRRKRN